MCIKPDTSLYQLHGQVFVQYERPQEADYYSYVYPEHYSICTHDINNGNSVSEKKGLASINKNDFFQTQYNS